MSDFPIVMIMIVAILSSLMLAWICFALKEALDRLSEVQRLFKSSNQTLVSIVGGLNDASKTIEKLESMIKELRNAQPEKAAPPNLSMRQLGARSDDPFKPPLARALPDSGKDLLKSEPRSSVSADTKNYPNVRPLEKKSSSFEPPPLLMQWTRFLPEYNRMQGCEGTYIDEYLKMGARFYSWRHEADELQIDPEGPFFGLPETNEETGLFYIARNHRGHDRETMDIDGLTRVFTVRYASPTAKDYRVKDRAIAVTGSSPDRLKILELGEMSVIDKNVPSPSF